jgi:tRNA(fMet)-specific endonuclease VapC
MVSAYLVDTDWAIDVLHSDQQATETLLRLAPEGLAVSYVTYAELYEGSFYAQAQERDLQGLRDFLAGKDLLPLTTEVMERFAILRGALSRPHRQQIGDMDLFIASTALTHNLTLLTRNVRDFQLVPGLLIYQEADAP